MHPLSLLEKLLWIPAKCLPAAWLCSFAYRSAQMIAPLLDSVRKPGFYKNRKANLFRFFLGAFTHSGRTFPIPLKIQGLDCVTQSDPRTGLILVSVHLPLNRLIHSALMPLGRSYACIAGPGMQRPFKEILGQPQCASPQLLKATPQVLVTAYKKLAQGMMLTSDIDFRHKHTGKFGLSPQLFLLAEKGGYGLVFFGTQLMQGGLVKVIFQPAPKGDLQQVQNAFLAFMAPIAGDWIQPYRFEKP